MQKQIQRTVTIVNHEKKKNKNDKKIKRNAVIKIEL